VAFLNLTFVRRDCGIGDTNVKFTPLAPIDAFQTHNQEDGNKVKRGQPRKIIDTKKTP
jgi:hypothetical protein